MKKLIVNADDFGLHPLINAGIIKGYKEGFITSTSLMPSAPCWQEAVKLAQENPQLGIGVHLTLVGSVAPVLPAAKVSSLLDEQGLFLPDYVAFAKRFYSGSVKRSELEAELRAQIERALEAKINITHIDSHQHTHVLPGINALVLKLCNEYNIIRVRIPREAYTFTGGFHTGIGRMIGRSGLSFCAQLAAQRADSLGLHHPQHFFGMLAGGHLNAELVGNILRQLPDGVSELMTHPGLDSVALGKIFPWQYHWQEEMQAYLDSGNKKLLEQEHIQAAEREIWSIADLPEESRAEYLILRGRIAAKKEQYENAILYLQQAREAENLSRLLRRELLLALERCYSETQQYKQAYECAAAQREL